MKSTDESHPLERQLKRACTRYNMAVAVWWWAPPGQYVALGRRINWGQYCTSRDKNLHHHILTFLEEISSPIFCNLYLETSYQLYVLFTYILSILCFIYGAICEILVGPLSGLGGNWPPITSRQHIDNISEYFQFHIFPQNTFINISQWLPRYQKREDQ